MYHPTGLSPFLRLQDVHRIPGSVPRVDHHGKPCLFGQVELAQKPFLLDFPLRLLPVIVQPDFPYGHTFFRPAHLP